MLQTHPIQAIKLNDMKIIAGGVKKTINFLIVRKTFFVVLTLLKTVFQHTV